MRRKGRKREKIINKKINLPTTETKDAIIKKPLTKTLITRRKVRKNR